MVTGWIVRNIYKIMLLLPPQVPNGNVRIQNEILVLPLHTGVSAQYVAQNHDNVIKWKYFPRYWPFLRVIHWSQMTSPHKGQWRGALIYIFFVLFSICAWTNGWVNNRDTGNWRRHQAHYDVTVMWNTVLSVISSPLVTFQIEVGVQCAVPAPSRLSQCVIQCHCVAWAW